jgi:hypothetical protein
MIRVALSLLTSAEAAVRGLVTLPCLTSVTLLQLYHKIILMSHATDAKQGYVKVPKEGKPSHALLE